MAQFKSLADRQADRAKALEKRAAQVRLLTNRPVKVNGVPRVEVQTNSPAEATPSWPQSAQVARRFGRAAIPVYRDDEDLCSVPAMAVQRLVDLYLHAAQHRSRHIAMLWPASPRNLVLVHALATLERWAEGDKQGIRGLTFPVKTNVFHPLNHLHLDRPAVLKNARALLETHENATVTRRCADKDAYLMSLANKSIEHLIGNLPQPSPSGCVKRACGSPNRTFEPWFFSAIRRIGPEMSAELCPAAVG